MNTVEMLSAVPRPLDLPKASVVSLVIPCHNESENISALYVRVAPVMERITQPGEVVCVNDGSTDDTMVQLLALHQEDPRIVVIDLSRNLGKQAALTARLDPALVGTVPF